MLYNFLVLKCLVNSKIYKNMNENLNLVDILKDCPRGTKLYSTIHGEVKFEEIKNGDKYPIIFYYRDIDGERYIDAVTDDGRHKFRFCGECTLFPEKHQRDWAKFKVEPEMVDGEIYYVKIGFVEWIYIYRKNYTYKTMHYVAVLNNYLMEFNNICTTHNEDIKVLRKATEEEKRLFFETIKKNGRKWDADKKELVRIEPKFGISTLQPYDKVLVRDRNINTWHCSFFDRLDKTSWYSFMCVGGRFHQCIPYNNETKHLHNTNEMPPEKYITWEE